MERYPEPCPHCLETNHEISELADGQKIVLCPNVTKGTYLFFIGGKVIRDNRGQFQRQKATPTVSEFPEFSDDLDFFDAHDTIEV